MFVVAVPVIIRGGSTVVRPEHPGMALSFTSSLSLEAGAEMMAQGPLSVGGTLVVDGATLIATNIQASSLLLTNSSLVTTFGPTATQVYQLDLVVTNAANVSTNSRIDVSGLGYLAGRTSGNTTVGGATGDSGGSYGGLGHNGYTIGTANAVYGDYANPNDWGSGGGTYYGNSSGGGLVRLAAGSLFLDGQVLADGQNQVSWPGYYSGGSGGGIYVSVGTLAGAGQIRASGADSLSGSILAPAGDGGGGRAAVYAQDYSGFNLANITAPGGPTGGAGTVYIQGETQSWLLIESGGTGVTPLGLPGSNMFVVAVPVIIRGGSTVVRPEHPGMALSFTSSLSLEAGAEMMAQGPLSVGGTLVVDGATLIATNIQASSLLLTNSSLVTTFGPTATQVYQLDLVVTNAANVSTNSRIDVSGLGYLAGRTSGNTTVGGATGDSGGSYGGLGHNGYTIGTANAVYGDYANPNDWGSGGGTYYGNSSGGGLVRLAAGSLFLDGQVLADGQNQVSWPGYYSGGSGGGIYVSVGTLAGAGQIRASGADSLSGSILAPAGDGGGGRAAVYAQDYSGFNLANITAPGGPTGGAGTVYVQGAITVNGKGAVTINTPAASSISTTGSLDQWTFLGRAGEQAVVEVDTGSTNVVSPQLNYAFVQLLDPSTNLLAEASIVALRQLATFLKATLPLDGFYTVTVYAPPRPSPIVGNYRLTVWDATPTPESLVINQQEYGQITTPYSANQWNFSAATGQQIQFDLINVSAPGIAFDLTGPNGWIGFSNLTSSSGLVTLPYSGAYSITAFSTGGAYDIAFAFELVQTAETNLAPGGTFTGTFAGNGQPQLLAVAVTNSGPLLITLNNSGANNSTELYVQLGSPPTRGAFGYESITPNSPNQQILIPSAPAGTYYILIYGNVISTPGSYTVEALAANVFLTSVTPNLSPNNAAITLTLNGSGFLPSTSVQLISTNDTSFPAASVAVDSFTQITATFASNALPTGVYSVQVSVPGSGSATLTNSFQALSTGAANFTSGLTVPSVIRQGSTATAYPRYANTGNAPMPAPLLVLTVQQNGLQEAFLGLDASMLAQGVWTSAQQPLGFNHSAQFLASGQIPGVLQPGESLTVPVYWAGWNGSLVPHGDLHWNLGVLTADNSFLVDWPSLEASMRPPNIPADAWHAIFTAFTAQVGTTWGGYVTMLDDILAYLGRLGLNVQDVSKLLAFQFMQADGLCPLQTLASSVDASVPAPGLPLVFSRSFGERISQRYAWGPLGRGWSHNWQYSLQQASDGTVTVTGPGGSQRVFQPDRRGGYFNQAGDYGTIAPAGGGAYTLTEKSGLLYYYQPSGSLGYVQDLNNNRITLGYTGGLLTGLTHSSGQNIQLGYNSAGLVQTVTDQFSHQTILTYDPANEHLVGAQYFDGRTATYTYNTNGSVTKLHALTGSAASCCNWRYFNYDSFGRLSGTYLAGNAEALTLSNSTGGQVIVTDALTNATQFFYDHRGLLAKTEDALGNLVQRSFDNNYNLVSVTDPTGRSYNYGYDSLGNLIQSADPLGDISQFTYTTAYNRLASVTDARGNTTQYGYDGPANLQSITYADRSVESWTHDPHGNPQTWTNRRGHQTIYTNNNNGQITAKQFADGSLSLYAYDFQGNLTNAATFDTNLNTLELSIMTYDGSNRLTQITYPGSKYLNFTYDSNGRRFSSTDQLGHSLYYFYDDAGRLQSMTNELNALVVLYHYDPAGRIFAKTLGNGMFTTYQHDPAGQLLNLTNALPNQTVLSYFNYTYDSRGRRKSMESLDGQWTYTYDDIGQLTHAVFATATTNIPSQDLLYIYDAVGNRIQTVENGVTNSYTPNNLNQYVSVGATNYTFDADGNLIQEVSPGGTITYQYNDENRLIALTSLQGNWQYTYNALANRTVITANGTATRDVIDPTGLGNVVAEYDVAGNLLAHYDHGLGLLSRSEPSGNPAYYAFAANANTRQLVNSSGGAACDYVYGPFGTALWKREGVSNPFQFVGEFGVQTLVNGPQFMRARYYSTATGRFLSSDLIGIVGGMNLYSYTLNNPLSQIDPVGLDSLPQCEARCFTQDPVISYLRENGGGIVGSAGKLIPFLPIPLPYLPSVAGGTALVGLGAAAVGGYSFGLLLRCNLDCNPGHYGGPAKTYLPDYGGLADGGSGNSQSITPGDPNQLTGPAGFAIQNYVIESNLFGYEISFENQTNATAPAQIVQITDPLSTSLNWQTFQLGEIAFGNTFIPIPPNIQHFQTNLPFSFDGVSFQVQIEAGINLANGQVFANFFSIDPLTGLPPEADVGFLPPEDGTGRGMGHVSYTIRPETGPAGRHANRKRRLYPI